MKIALTVVLGLSIALTSCSSNAPRPDSGESFKPCQPLSEAPRKPPVQPVYPAYEKENGITGTTVLLVSINDSGDVVEVAVSQSSGNANLDASAVTAAHDWQFTPGCKNGHAVGGHIIVPIGFKLK